MIKFDSNLYLCSRTVLLSLVLSFGESEVTVSESGTTGPVLPGGLPLLVVTVQGSAVGDIPVRILPTTYDQFQTDYSLSILNQLFPTRPINPAGSKEHALHKTRAMGAILWPWGHVLAEHNQQ